MELPTQKSSMWWITILAASYNISKNRLVHRRRPSSYCEKYHVQNTSLRQYSILVKKIVSLDLYWAKIWRNKFVEGVLLKACYDFGNS